MKATATVAQVLLQQNQVTHLYTADDDLGSQ